MICDDAGSAARAPSDPTSGAGSSCGAAQDDGEASEEDNCADGRENITLRPARVITISPAAANRSMCRLIERPEQPIRAPSSPKVSAVHPARPIARSTTSALSRSEGEHSPAAIAAISRIDTSSHAVPRPPRTNNS